MIFGCIVSMEHLNIFVENWQFSVAEQNFLQTNVLGFFCLLALRIEAAQQHTIILLGASGPAAIPSYSLPGWNMDVL